MSEAGTSGAGLAGEPRTASVLEGAARQGAAPRRRAPHSTGLWKVGSLDPTVVKVLTFLGFAIPVGAYLALLAHYQVNAVSGDQWSDVQTIAQSYRHFPDWSSLWSLHVDNRVFFPNLIVIGLAHTVSFNVEVEEYLSALLLLGAVALFIWAHKRRSPETPLLFYCPVAFVMLSFTQWQNTLWGFQMAWYLVLFAVALSITLLDRRALGWPVFVAAVLVAIVASYSSLQGLLVWPAGLVLLYHRRRPAWALTSWIAAGVAATVLYFNNYHVAHPGSTPSYAAQHPLLFVKFFLFALGDVVGVPAKFLGLTGEANGGSGNPAVIAFGAVILVLAVFVVLKWGIRRDEKSGAPIGIAMIVFGLLFDALVTEGRLDFGFWGASQSRYTTYDLLVLVGIFLTTLGASSRVEAATATRRSRHAPASARSLVDRIEPRTVTLVALVAMAIQLALGVHYGLQGARVEHQDYVTSEILTRNIDHESSATVYRLYIGETPQQIREQAAFLRAHHLSEFG